MESCCESLIDVLAVAPKRELLVVEGCCAEEFVAFYLLAMKFDRLPAGAKFRALCEGWDQVRVVRELH